MASWDGIVFSLKQYNVLSVLLFSVTRVVNSYGPQTRALGLGQDVSPSKPQVIKQESNTDGIDERLRNIETHLKMKGNLCEMESLLV